MNKSSWLYISKLCFFKFLFSFLRIQFEFNLDSYFRVTNVVGVGHLSSLCNQLTLKTEGGVCGCGDICCITLESGSGSPDGRMDWRSSSW